MGLWRGSGSEKPTDTHKGTMGETREFIPNKELGKSRRQLTEQIREANAEKRKRDNNGLTTEDQRWDVRNSRDARSRQN